MSTAAEVTTELVHQWPAWLFAVRAVGVAWAGWYLGRLLVAIALVSWKLRQVRRRAQWQATQPPYDWAAA